jgi:hypothetical protein
MKRYIPVILIIFTAAAVFPVDFGLNLGGDGEYRGGPMPKSFSLTGSVSPWISAVLTEKVNFHISGSMTIEYDENQGMGPFLFELERTELNLHPASVAYFTLGRQRFGDMAGMIASGLFDGLNGTLNLGPCRLTLGAFYTGLLYKESANILMTAEDSQRYATPVDAPNLEGYFASRRILLALTGEFPDLASRFGLGLQGLAQFDLNGDANPLNTQYLELRFLMELADSLHGNVGGIGELAQSAGEMWWSGAGFGGLDWEVPGSLADLVSAEFRWTSGKSGEKFQAFMPVSGKQAGKIFDAGATALMNAGLSYRARPALAFSLELGGAYFIRMDFESLMDSELDGASTSRLLGGEVYGSLVLAPDAAIRLSAGGGAFFPQWGEAFAQDTPVRWKVNLGLLLSL